ncbi:hypothetical protein K461DRAFT_322097 [Myriangium duriaei CBS 260.36]|uniref:Zn(2)-C6 fungal-type domain-containing protein n=1 Tax=Myriangium duriaei CBS 260.36 TaxID=1168546 RepID=A0A9P4J3Z5_9PEZI|nr:hypothetical protein K461DRAFT_322097 [Myriangium duriaei CBS 260.36]
MELQSSTLPPPQVKQEPARVSPVPHHAQPHLHHYTTPSPAPVGSHPPPPPVNGHSSQSHPSPHSQQPRPHFLHHQSYTGSDPARHTSYSHDALNGTNGANGASAGQKSIYPPLQPHPEPDMRTPKREIKRRTKTGCLTCRRRRIKCDEGQPTCGNCRKSKRECLGYDPIFKASPMHTTHNPATVTFPPALPSPIHQLQQATRPPPLEVQQAYHLPLPHSQPPQSRTPPPPPTHIPPPQNSNVPYDSPVDPSLNTSTPAQSPPSALPPPTVQEAYIPGLRSFRKRKHIIMDDLYGAEGSAPSIFSALPSLPAATPQTDVAEVMSIWRSQYSGMLDSFFETHWYSQEGSAWLGNMSDKMNFFISCHKLFQMRPAPGSAEAAAIPYLEARLVWILADVPRHAWAIKKTADPQLADLLHRLDVVEALLTGAILPPNLIPPAPAPPPRISGRDLPPSPEFISHSFWHHLGCFCAADDTFPPLPQTSNNQHQHHHLQQLTASLLSMRQILSVLENRDVLYSIAIARHFGGRLERLELDKLPAAPAGSDNEHPFKKLSVALGFLAEEEHNGTTAVVRGFAALAQRAVVRGRYVDVD